MDLKELQKFWYQRLKDEGFEDLEDEKGELKPGPRFSDTKTNQFFSAAEFEERSEYTSRAQQFLQEYMFESKRDSDIWEMHTEGISIRAITIILNAISPTIKKTQVHDTVKRLRKIMLEAYL